MVTRSLAVMSTLAINPIFNPGQKSRLLMYQEINDNNDGDFMGGMEALFGLDEAAVSDILNELTLEQMIDLAAAVTNNDYETGNKIVQFVQKKIGKGDKPENQSVDSTKAPKEVKKSDITTSMKTVPVKKSKDDDDDEKEEEEAIDDRVFNVGDAVQIGNDSATIKIPKAPGGTVGVMVKGKLQMVDKKDVKKIDESISEITELPSLQRIRELAGLVCQSNTDPHVHVQAEIPSGVTDGSAQAQSDNPLSICLASLDGLERAMSDIKLADLKIVRKRLNDINCKMNESLSRAGKKIIGETLKGR